MSELGFYTLIDVEVNKSTKYISLNMPSSKISARKIFNYFRNN